MPTSERRMPCACSAGNAVRLSKTIACSVSLPNLHIQRLGKGLCSVNATQHSSVHCGCLASGLPKHTPAKNCKRLGAGVVA